MVHRTGGWIDSDSCARSLADTKRWASTKQIPSLEPGPAVFQVVGGKGYVVGEQRGYQSRQHHIKLVLNEVGALVCCFARFERLHGCSNGLCRCGCLSAATLAR